MDNVLNRLSHIFPHRDILVKLAEFGVIAGGAMVYALCDFVPLKSVGDIDVFVNSRENYMKCINLLNSYSAKFYAIQFTDALKPNYSVVSVIINKYEIQIIFFEYETVWDVLDHFDIDYVQCAIHKDGIYMTGRCKKAHVNRQIFEFADTRFRNNRFAKAANKGFKTPILQYNVYEKVSSYYTECTYDNINSNHILKFKNNAYLTLDRDDWFSIESLEIVGINKKICTVKMKSLSKEITSKITSFSYKFNNIMDGKYGDYITGDENLKYLKSKERLPIVGEKLSPTDGSITLIISPLKLKIFNFKAVLYRAYIKSIASENVLPVRMTKYFEYNMLGGTIDFSIDREAVITKLCKELENSDKLAIRSAAGVYSYEISRGKSEEKAVEQAIIVYVIDQHKEKYGGYNNTSEIAKSLFHQYGIKYGPYRGECSQKIKTFEEFYDMILEK